MGGFKFDVLKALLKLTLNASGDTCRVGSLAAQGEGARLATARHSSQVSQVHPAATSSDDA